MPKHAKLGPCQNDTLLRGTASLASVVAEFVMPCLGPQQLLLFAQVCKLWRAAVTTASGAFLRALRCAVLAARGHNNYVHVLNLFEKVQAGKVHPPSPLRLLRFACGLRCELATCRGQDAAGNRRAHSRGLVTDSQLEYGVFAC